jgi:hypothetical protein
MEKYIGTKILLAQPETLGEYNVRRGWTIPENENPDRAGYFVEYSDGYVSWSPKEVFEEAYQRIPEDCPFTDEAVLRATRSTVDGFTRTSGSLGCAQGHDPDYQVKYERTQCLQAAITLCWNGDDPVELARKLHTYVLNG